MGKVQKSKTKIKKDQMLLVIKYKEMLIKVKMKTKKDSPESLLGD